ncbi:NAD(P)-binding protein [Trematosphaeria pertusa]|uniref:NAD(P)-binding protein n=1 Tax=Trematosphaeria pertusa TaxID=390896 RepID=A0A6A6ITJ7_9PLEO|nr:NAD(P)-binding protein [Trematosphaeria pertusa]KAF2253845.1 NAD(P)-binding protein [Trematosphaeria pertusa]
MTILVTGSTGKTSLRLAQQLRAASLHYLIATRRSSLPDNHPSTKLDLTDPSTYPNPFASAADITGIYLVAPDTTEPAPHLNAFIDHAVSHGVLHFVLLAGTSATEKGGPYVGTVWSYLDALVAAKGVSYAVLRPTWFMENFSEMQHVATIKSESAFYSTAGDGKMPFISADDIAAAASVFLSDPARLDNKDHILLGPQLLSHDEVARIFSGVLGREIRHVRRSQEEMVEQYTKVGVKPMFAHFLPFLETKVKAGEEAKFVDGFEDVVGRKGIDFKTWAEREAKKGYWA